MEGKKVLLAMSGGVDSSAAAVYLQNEGYDISGAIMQMFESTETAKSICDAKKVAESLNIYFSVINAEKEFKKDVIESFVSSYLAGETPNPCIVCNKKLKFGLFLDYADSIGAELIATGHYASVDKAGSRYVIRKGKDVKKDQSYVLYSLSQDVLSRLVLPLGKYTKDEVRELSKKALLETAEKKESQDICFIPDGDYAGYIEGYLGKEAECGEFVTSDGNIIGHHKGIIKYTIGQHKKLGLGIHIPYYVLSKDSKSNRIVLGSNDELFTKTVYANCLNFMAVEDIAAPIRVMAKIRYKHAEQSATVEKISEDTVKITFDEPVRAVTPGQAVVFYDGDIVIGGGTIISSANA